MTFVGGCSCGQRVLRVDIGDTMTAVDVQPHPAGRIEVHYVGPIPYGRKLAHGSATTTGSNTTPSTQLRQGDTQRLSSPSTSHPRRAHRSLSTPRTLSKRSRTPTKLGCLLSAHSAADGARMSPGSNSATSGNWTSRLPKRTTRMPRPKFARKPGDLPSGTTPKRRDITDTDRRIVLDAILNESDDTWKDVPRWVMNVAAAKANITRFDAEAIATCAGWSNRARVQAARDRYAAEAGL